MASATTNPGPPRPLDGLRFELAGSAALTRVADDHLRRLGASAAEPGEPGEPGGAGSGPCLPGDGHVRLGGGGLGSVRARAGWGAPGSGAEDEATAQAVTGVMAVHGRRHGTPRGLGVDLLATATGVLTVQGLLAALIGRARGGTPAARVETAADRTGLLLVSQYLAAAGADEPEAVELAPGGPPFTSRDGVVFELETLDPGAWAEFWRDLDAPADAVRTGWRPFQFRYATACAPLPRALHATALAHGIERVRQAAARSGAEVCRLRTLAERAREDDGADPWSLRPLGRPEPGAPAAAAGRAAPAAAPAPADRPLEGLTVLEAGRRIQAPLAAHLLGLLGARVIRIEPPGGDPLRGMPPACSGVSARWLALNRGKDAVELDIKSPRDRDALRGLAADADVFLHNWAPGKAAELGLDAEDMSAANPALVYAYTGGWADRIQDAPMGTDFMVQARTGVGEAVHPADEPPVPSLMTLLDLLGGLHGTEAVLAGLLLRERTGHGVRVDSSLLGAADTLLAPALRRAARGDAPRVPAGFRATLPTADGRIAPADRSAAAAAAYDLSTLPTARALALLRERGLAATRVVTDLGELLGAGRTEAIRPSAAGGAGSRPPTAGTTTTTAVATRAPAPAATLRPRPSGPIGRDEHGAPTVPDPWSFA
ncbi:CoA transferase [Streptomyces showdoensis]|uniref:Acyl-CoA transferase n=1 Tax=Streptomyces showdoensis TaxID=68268 RepID=A0A2P2GQT8_STREW|nr:CoA transferase [Streptomyces showdoensis]KKZ73229.1 acyl-CoA transferase [Streptomyces showdoensis]